MEDYIVSWQDIWVDFAGLMDIEDFAEEDIVSQLGILAEFVGLVDIEDFEEDLMEDIECQKGMGRAVADFQGKQGFANLDLDLDFVFGGNYNFENAADQKGRVDLMSSLDQKDMFVHLQEVADIGGVFRSSNQYMGLSNVLQSSSCQRKVS